MLLKEILLKKQRLKFKVEYLIIMLVVLTGICQKVSAASFKIPYCDCPLSNPYKGFYTNDYTKLTNTILPQRLAYSSFTWRDLEGEKRGKFNWKKIEKNWKWHTKQNRHIAIRLKIADPWTNSEQDFPSWLEKLNVKKARYYIDGGTGFVPNWNSEVFLKEHERVILKLGERYNNDPRVAWVELGSYGIWGEWHMYQNEQYSASFFSKMRIINAYLKAFPDKKLVILFDDKDALSYMTNMGSGIRNDCLGDPLSNKWFEQSLINSSIYNTDKIAKRQFIIGEYCSGEQGANHALKYHFKENLYFVKKYHWSSIGPAGGSLLNSSSNAALMLHKTLGYRFSLVNSNIPSNIHLNENLPIKLTLRNEGVAPFYYKWKTKIYIKNSQNEVIFDYYIPGEGWEPTNWTPGVKNLETVLPLGLLGFRLGKYKVYIGIEDKHTLKPGVKFANKLSDKNNRYYIGEFEVTPFEMLK